ncbi:hypothetical protein QUF74_09465 [Candidatus Halobeggiatoa sp. HSG11]|nr:hypothetical protein [Candidatus Halobeggiatoa sp. HSG11]
MIWATTAGTGKGGEIHIKVENLQILKNGAINSNSSSTGSGGEIQIEAQQLHMDTGGQITSMALDQGNAGNILLQIDNLLLANGAQINASSKSNGQGGAITVTVTDTANFFGQSEDEEITPSGIASSAFGKGNGGTIQLTVETLNLDKRGTVQTLTKGEGKSGNIIIHVKDLNITEGGDIDASNEGTGQSKGGDVIINATGKVFITAELHEGEFLGGIYSSAENDGAGGDISLTTEQLTLKQGGSVSAASNGSGDAGHLTLNINDTLKIEEAGQINTSTQNAAGGNISLSIPNLLYLHDGQITTSVKGGKGDGGNIAISPPTFVIMNGGKIIAQANEGHGGNINIKSDQFITSTNSLISASSKFGIDGEIIIDSPDTDIGGKLFVLETDMANAADQLKDSCNSRIADNLSTLTLIQTEGVHKPPDDLLPSQPIFFTPKPLKLQATKRYNNKLLAQAGCRLK